MRGVSTNSSEFKIGGILFLSLTPTKEGASTIYSYNIDTLEFKEEDGLPPGMNYSSAISPDGQYIAFGHYDSGGLMQIYVLNRQTGDVRQLTTEGDKYKRLPAWSPDGKLVAFVSTNEEKNSPNFPTDIWSVYVVDLEGKTEFITQGYRPLFSPSSDTMLVLRSDGLRLFSLVKDPKEVYSSELVWGMSGGQAHNNMKLSLSQDKTQLAWTNLYTPRIDLFSISSWDPFKMKKTYTINTFGVWAIFSPDGKFLAIQTSDEEKREGVPSAAPKIDIYNLETFEHATALNLQGFDFTNLLLSDWIYNSLHYKPKS